MAEYYRKKDIIDLLKKHRNQTALYSLFENNNHNLKSFDVEKLIQLLSNRSNNMQIKKNKSYEYIQGYQKAITQTIKTLQSIES